jgi:hypothetical protein
MLSMSKKKNERTPLSTTDFQSLTEKTCLDTINSLDATPKERFAALQLLGRTKPLGFSKPTDPEPSTAAIDAKTAQILAELFDENFVRLDYKSAALLLIAAERKEQADGSAVTALRQALEHRGKDTGNMTWLHNRVS